MMACSTFSQPWPPSFQHRYGQTEMRNIPVHSKVLSSLSAPDSSAAVAVTILKIDPGEYSAWIARFCSGLRASLSRVSQWLREIRPPATQFGSDLGEVA